MARTPITLTKLTANGSVVSTASGFGQAGDSTNDHVVDPADGSLPGITLEQIFLQVINGATDVVVTVLAGDSPPALEAGLGNLAVTVSANTSRMIGPFSSARFAQSDGTLHVDLDDDSNVRVAAVVVPRTA